ncbi:MAG: formylglycine-generating enzyme family protein [Gammaproteobacteria bacterium]
MLTAYYWHMRRLVLAFFLALAVPPDESAAEPLELLAQPGPWAGISSLIGYRGRVWFANSVKFVNHNSADLHSYDPRSGKTRYERHLFSPDAGDPVVADGLLYWPFEDGRFSTGRGEYAVTNGDHWRWNTLRKGQAYHVHAIAALGRDLYAAQSAWRATVQRYHHETATWDVVYEHETPSGLVSRLTSLAALGDALYAGLTSRRQAGAKLFRLQAGTVMPVAGWPNGQRTIALEAHADWLYAVNIDRGKRSVWRTDGLRVQQVDALAGRNIRAFASGPDALFAVSAGKGAGRLWRSPHGLRWGEVQHFSNAEPLDVFVHAGHPYVGTQGPGEKGGLWGPSAPAPAAPLSPQAPLPSPSVVSVEDADAMWAELDAVLDSGSDFGAYREQLHELLQPLALSRRPEIGHELARRLEQRAPAGEVSVFTGRMPLARLKRWMLLWGMGLNGHGRVPVEFLAEAWDKPANPAEKYFNVVPAAVWVAAELRQDDCRTIDALIGRLGRTADPEWLDGDLIGALTALTGQRFAYDTAQWRAWWKTAAAAYGEPMIRIPAGELLMGTNDGEAAEAPPHKVTLSSFLIDRFEVTNAAFETFVQATGHVTDAERNDKGWHWEGEWATVAGADWRHPRGPESTIDALAEHPVVQVSWNDARAFCAWRNKRLPTEAQWERAARGGGDRRYAWGNALPAIAETYRASYGADECCAPDEADGYRYTAPSGSFPGGASPFGVEDITGNVWEWVEDSFDPAYYQSSPQADPVNTAQTKRKVIRGGGWGNNPWGLRATLRHANPPDVGLSMVGFRCARINGVRLD